MRSIFTGCSIFSATLRKSPFVINVGTTQRKLLIMSLTNIKISYFFRLLILSWSPSVNTFYYEIFQFCWFLSQHSESAIKGNNVNLKMKFFWRDFTQLQNRLFIGVSWYFLIMSAFINSCKERISIHSCHYLNIN